MALGSQLHDGHKDGPADAFARALKRLGHLGEKLLVINHILTTNNRSEVHFNAELSTPWREVLKDLSITFSFEEDGHWPAPGARGSFKAIKVVALPFA